MNKINFNFLLKINNKYKNYNKNYYLNLLINYQLMIRII